MSQVMLQGPRILFIIRGFETTGMAKHVRMDLDGDLGLLPGPGYHFPHGVDGQAVRIRSGVHHFEYSVEVL